jgi:hypothetical protein
MCGVASVATDGADTTGAAMLALRGLASMLLHHV